MPKVKVNDIEIYYKVKGEGESLVLIHGITGSTMNWLYQIPEFSMHYKVIIYDIRGHGKTDKPKQKYSIKLFADDLRGLLNKLGIDKAHVLGVSMGGLIAQQFTLDNPDKVKSLILVATLSEMREVLVQLSNNWILYAKKLGMEAIFNELLVWTCTDKMLKIGKKRREMLKKLYLEDNDQVHAFLATRDAVVEFNVTSQLPEIKAPTLILIGDHDILHLLEMSQIIHKNIPNSELKIIQDAGSLPIMDNKGIPLNNMVLEFLKKVSNS